MIQAVHESLFGRRLLMRYYRIIRRYSEKNGIRIRCRQNFVLEEHLQEFRSEIKTYISIFKLNNNGKL